MRNRIEQYYTKLVLLFYRSDDLKSTIVILDDYLKKFD
jgi:hypothetical protein